MDEFYFKVDVINGYDYKCDSDNYRHILIDLPITKEDLEVAFEEIGLNITARPSEYYTQIANVEIYHIYYAGSLFTGDENIDELNYLAGMLSNLDKEEYDAFAAAVEVDEHTKNISDLINLVEI